jgi:hypothetical protein
MAKAAIFVEGMTEVVFVRRLLEELAGSALCVFTIEEFRKNSFSVVSVGVSSTHEHEFLVVDCGSDSSVLTAVLDRHGSLARAGYNYVCALRDLYPVPDGDLAQLEADIASYLPAVAPPIKVFIAKREVEAWFIQEDLHFPKIDTAINRASIHHQSGYDIELDSAETIGHPAGFLDDCYKIGGKRYKKRRKSVSRTVKCLDFENLCIERVARVPSFQSLLYELEMIIAT